MVMFAHSSSRDYHEGSWLCLQSAVLNQPRSFRNITNTAVVINGRIIIIIIIMAIVITVVVIGIL